MKFKSKMTDPSAMRDFTNVANTISRMAKECVLRLTADSVCFNVADETTSMVWTTLRQEFFFDEYSITGKSEEYNEIYMELNTSMLSKSVSSLRNAARSVKIKLTNKQQPCLTFEIELPSISAESRMCTHDIPINIIPQKKWKEYDSPNIPSYDVTLEMPQFKSLKSVLERIKNMSPTLIVVAEPNGVLSFKVDTDSAVITVHFPALTVFNFSQETDSISASVEIKKFHAFLAWEAVHPTKTTCNIIDDRVINLNLSLDDHIQIEYYIPAVAIA